MTAARFGSRLAVEHDGWYDLLAEIRETAPFSPILEWAMVVTGRHDLVSQVLRDRRFGRDGTGVGMVDPHHAATPTWNRYVRGSFMELDPPAHTRLRSLVGGAFTRRGVASLEPRLRRIASDCIEHGVANGRLDIVHGLATPLAVEAITRLLGLSPELGPSLVEWSRDIVALFEPAASVGAAARAESATVQFAAMLSHEVDGRRSQPADDLLSALVHAAEGGERLSHDEIVATAILLLNAGHEATVHAIGNAVVALADHPDALAGLATGVDHAAVDELLRFDPPLQLFHRWTFEDVTIGDTRLEAGTKVGVLLGAANRDPRSHARPERLDVRRSPQRQLSFGAGVHHCLGAPLARLELKIALEALIAATTPTAWSSLDCGPWVDSVVFRGRTHVTMPVASGHTSPTASA